MIRPFPLLATIISLIALGFYIAALSSSSWLVENNSIRQLRVGAFYSCFQSKSTSYAECSYVDNDCMASFGALGGGSMSISNNCTELRVVKAFIVIATIFTGLAVLNQYLSCFTRIPFISMRLPSAGLSVLAGIFGVIGWAVFIAIANSSLYTHSVYSWAFGLVTAAWILNFISSIFSLIPFPMSPYEYDEADLVRARAARGAAGEPLALSSATVMREPSSFERLLGFKERPHTYAKGEEPTQSAPSTLPKTETA